MLFCVCRHLPMVAALLHGRTHLNFQEFRQQSHLVFFLHVLGLLELLQPQVFRSEHQGALWDCLLSFVRLLLVRALRLALRGTAEAVLSCWPCPPDAAAWVVGLFWAQQPGPRDACLPVQLVPLPLPRPWPGPSL